MAGALGFVAATGGHRLAARLDHRPGDPCRLRRAGWAAVAAAAVIGVSVASGVSVMLRRWFLAMAELRTQRDWRRALLYRYVDLPMDFHPRGGRGGTAGPRRLDVNTATMVLRPLAFAVSVVVPSA